MSLRDEHLQHALQNAPDRDAAPNDAVRKKVLEYAKSTTKPTRIGFLQSCVDWFKHWHINSWQLVGMSTIASVLLITFALREQVPSEPLWVNADEQDIAQTKIEPPPVRKSLQDKREVQKEKSDEVASQEDEIALGKSTANAVIVDRAAKKQAIDKKNALEETRVSSQRTQGVDQPMKRLEGESSAVSVASPVPDNKRKRIAATKQADRFERLDMDDASSISEAEAVMERPTAAVKAAVGDRSQQALAEDVVMLGIALAKNDIQAGNFRILYAGNDWPEGKPLFDIETGFRVEMVKNMPIKIAKEELQAYNQAMRDWYHANEDLEN